jgi:predicted unusual protein kinase regulating ubiquinone biosynthesis (AarF/ABC1/UbiB family)
MAAGLATEAAGAGVKLASAGKEVATDQLHRKAAQRLAEVLGDMKGLPMKFGQLLSFIDDAIPEAQRHYYNDVLGQLQSNTTPLPWAEIEPVLTEDLGGAVEEVFGSFDKTPRAAASIGQVYRATLKDGTAVAVKVQYPGVAEAIDADLANVGALVASIETVIQSDFHHVLEDVTARIKEECDYELEAANQGQFAALWATDKEVVIPNMFPQHCGRRVLTSEWIDAMDYRTMMATCTDEEKQVYARLMWRFVYQSLYNHRLLNADPHPGNYLFLPEGRICFIDFGCVQTFAPEQIEGLRAVRHHAINKSPDHILRPLCVAHFGLPPNQSDALWHIFKRYLDLSFVPLTAQQPWTFSRDYTSQLTEFALEAKMEIAKEAVKGGLQDPQSPGIVFLMRLNYGVTTLLANMGARANWHQALIEAGID